MVEVDGVKYISEKEFNEAVLTELADVSHVITDYVVKTGDWATGLAEGHVIAEAYANLGNELFKKSVNNVKEGK